MTATSKIDTEDDALDPKHRIVAKGIGERIVAARAARDMTQVGLAMRACVDISYLSRVENGHSMPSVKVIDRICRALSFESDPVTLDHIVYGRSPQQ